MAQIEPITWFRNAHPEQGSLRVQVSAAQGIFPIPGASVEVYRDFGAVRETFYSGVTDSSGALADRYSCRPCQHPGTVVGHGGHQRNGLYRGGEPPRTTTVRSTSRCWCFPVLSPCWR